MRTGIGISIIEDQCHRNPPECPFLGLINANNKGFFFSPEQGGPFQGE